jgi:hypothetical protein
MSTINNLAIQQHSESLCSVVESRAYKSDCSFLTRWNIVVSEYISTAQQTGTAEANFDSSQSLNFRTSMYMSKSAPSSPIVCL